MKHSMTHLHVHSHKLPLLSEGIIVQDAYLPIILTEIKDRFHIREQKWYTETLKYADDSRPGLLEMGEVVNDSRDQGDIYLGFDWLKKILTDHEIPYDSTEERARDQSEVFENLTTTYYRPNNNPQFIEIKAKDKYLDAEFLQSHIDEPELLKTLIESTCDKCKEPEPLGDLKVSEDNMALIISYKFIGDYDD